MNDRQKKVIFITVGLMALMLLFPPCIILNYKHAVLQAGYGFIFSLPSYTMRSGGSIPGTINGTTLSIQIGIAIIGCILLCLALKDNNSK